MMRVKFVHYGRKIANRATVKATAMFLMTAASTFFFSVSNVFNNLKNIRVGDIDGFSIYAFSHTSLAVQALMICIAVLAVFFLKDLFTLAREGRSDLQFN